MGPGGSSQGGTGLRWGPRMMPRGCWRPRPSALGTATRLLPSSSRALVARTGQGLGRPCGRGCCSTWPRLLSRMPARKGLIPLRGRTWGRRLLSSSEAPVAAVPSVRTPGEEREGGAPDHSRTPRLLCRRERWGGCREVDTDEDTEQGRWRAAGTPPQGGWGTRWGGMLLEAGRDKEADSPLEPPEGVQPR